MAFDVKASFDFEAAFNGLNKRLDEQNKKLREYLERPHANFRQLFGTVGTNTTGTNPILDIGSPCGGMLWSVQQVVLMTTDSFTSGVTNVTNTQADQTGTGAASAITLTMPATAGQTNFIQGFQITGGGATAASVITVTLAGVQGGTQTFDIVVPAGATASITPLIVSFPTPLPASGANVAIVLTVPSFGAGNTNSAASLDGFRSTSATNAATTATTSASIFAGGLPGQSQIQFGQDMAQVVATSLAVPSNYQAGGKSIIVRGNNQHLYAVFNAQPAQQFFATATVLEVPDTSEALVWL